MPRHGSGQQVQRSSAGSIPHDRTKILQICSSHPRPLHRPRQSASRHPPVVTNRPATDRVRRDPRLIQQPFHHPPACWSASTPFTHLIRGTQIPIAKPQHPRPPPAVSSLGGLRTPAPRAGRATVMGPPSANLHRTGRSPAVAFGRVEMWPVALGRTFLCRPVGVERTTQIGSPGPRCRRRRGDVGWSDASRPPQAQVADRRSPVNSPLTNAAQPVVIARSP